MNISRPYKSCQNIIYDLGTQRVNVRICAFSLTLSSSALHTPLLPFLYLKLLTLTGGTQEAAVESSLTKHNSSSIFELLISYLGMSETQ